jgi:hypothetical protein
MECTDHHLIPQMVNDRNKFKKSLSKDDRKEKVPMCRPCHGQIHKMFTEKELGEQFYTVELLLAQESVQKWVNWIKNKPIGFDPPRKKLKK